MANELGLRNVAFEVDDLQAAIDRLAADGYGLVGGIGQYERAHLAHGLRARTGADRRVPGRADRLTPPSSKPAVSPDRAGHATPVFPSGGSRVAPYASRTLPTRDSYAELLPALLMRCSRCSKPNSLTPARARARSAADPGERSHHNAAKADTGIVPPHDPAAM